MTVKQNSAVSPAQDDWLQYIQSLIVTPAKITVESANDLGHVNYVGRPVVHVLDSERSRQAAHSDLKTLLTPTPYVWRIYLSYVWSKCWQIVLHSKYSNDVPETGAVLRGGGVAP